MKVRAIKTPNEEISGYRFRCPGCGDEHGVMIKPYANWNGQSWTFDGDDKNPTFHPSIKETVGPFPEDAQVPGLNADRSLVCHFTVRAGIITFLADCTHKLSGQSMELPDIAA